MVKTLSRALWGYQAVSSRAEYNEISNNRPKEQTVYLFSIYACNPTMRGQLLNKQCMHAKQVHTIRFQVRSMQR